ncbi:MAG: hypothetical protein ABIP64_04700 [Burkholderiales bacterium]
MNAHLKVTDRSERELAEVDFDYRRARRPLWRNIFATHGLAHLSRRVGNQFFPHRCAALKRSSK